MMAKKISGHLIDVMSWKEVTIHLCHRHSVKTQREIVKRFGSGESGVTQASRPIGRKAEEDTRLRAIVKTIERRITLSHV